MTMNRMFFVGVLVLLMLTPTFGQEKASRAEANPRVSMELVPTEVRPGQTAKLLVRVKLHPEYLTYPITQPDPREKASQTILQLPALPQDLIPISVADPKDYKEKPGGEGGTMAYYMGGTTWEIPVVVSPKATAGEKTYKLERLRLIICLKRGTDEACLAPITFPVATTFTVKGEPQDVEAPYKPLVEEALNGKKSPEPKTPGGTTEAPAKPKTAIARKIVVDRDAAADLNDVAAQIPPPDIKNTGFWVFLGTAFSFGLVTLFTPCVFPMVPITVSVFLKQSERQGANPLVFALIYSVTIVIVLSLAAMTLLTTFSKLAVNPYMNVALGLLFLALTLSLFGMFELTLPSSLANFIGSKEGQGGYLGIVFMAISFTIVSFTCVAPFLGGFSGMASSGNFSTMQLAAGALAFAGAFASPFFLLALFPSLLKKLPKSGDWMNTIKVTMGFLELAAALKFFRTAELRWSSPPVIFTYDFVLALWIGILVVLGLYLIGIFRTVHDHAEHVHIKPLRLLFALAHFGVAVYLAPALLTIKNERQRPAGTLYAWVDAFLLPEPSAGGAAEGELAWSGDLRGSLDDARAKGGVVFVDFTGKTCANCRLNERNVFTKPEVQELFKKYTLVALYTDTVPEEYYDKAPGIDRQNRDGELLNKPFQLKVTGSEMLPTYMLLKPTPDGKITVLGVYDEGKINNEAKFIEFLRKGLD